MKGLLSAFAVVLATTACAGNSGEKKYQEKKIAPANATIPNTYLVTEFIPLPFFNCFSPLLIFQK